MNDHPITGRSAAYFDQMRDADEALDDALAAVRAEETARRITAAEAAAERIGLLERHIAESRRLRRGLDRPAAPAPDPADGPFRTRGEAEAAFAAFRDAALRGRSGPPGEELAFTTARLLAEDLADTIETLSAGTGAYDQMLIARLAAYLDPVDVEVVCSWIRRAARDRPDPDGPCIVNPGLQLPGDGQ